MGRKHAGAERFGGRHFRGRHTAILGGSAAHA